MDAVTARMLRCSRLAALLLTLLLRGGGVAGLPRAHRARSASSAARTSWAGRGTAATRGHVVEMAKARAEAVGRNSSRSLEIEQRVEDFLSGSNALVLTDESPQPALGMGPADVVETLLGALQDRHQPTRYHGAAVLMSFCVPLLRRELAQPCTDEWRALLRTSLTAKMLDAAIDAGRYRCLFEISEFEILSGGDDTGGAEGRPPAASGAGGAGDVRGAGGVFHGSREDIVVKAVLRSGRETSVQFSLQRTGAGIWLLHSLRVLHDSLFD